MVRMRTRNILLPCMALAGGVSATNDAYLWTVDAGEVRPSSNQVSAISSHTGQQILARRKGITDYHFVDSASQDVLADLNRYGGWQSPLFGVDESKPPAKVFIRISGFEGGVSEFNVLPDLWIEDAETTLLDTFEAGFENNKLCEYHITPRMKTDVSIKYTYYPAADENCLPKSQIETSPSMLAITATVPLADKVAGKGISAFHRTLVHLSATENLESTLLILPATSKLKKPTKSELRKRGESPLDLPAELATTTFSATNRSNSNFTLPKVIPKYFTSKGACVNTTNSCMSNGKCDLTHGNLYFCNCTSTLVRTNADGTNKTVQWGGNACQKKDVSVQFILFAAFGIFFTAVVAGAIGMLFNMGSQQLPSVIGAGVVGPRAQR